ncbi:MAG: DUF6134 family protein [Rhodobacteraceae bacterium]|nr:DUF6134 family protein [Paracoccaceae bacterium]
MTPTRRIFLAGLGSATALAGFTATPALAATSTRRFSAVLGRKQVGETSVMLTRTGGRVIAEVEARLDISILGIINFNYHLSSREVWQNGVLQELRASTNNDGTAEYVNANRVDGGLQIDGTGFQGVVAGNPATTSYFTADFMARPTWISTQTGKPLDLTIRNAGTSTFNTNEGALNCTKYITQGPLKINLYYDSSFEWVGTNFRVAGRTANIAMTSRGQPFNAIWTG